METLQHIRLHKKIVSRRLHIITPSLFEIYAFYICKMFASNIKKQQNGFKKQPTFFKKIETLRLNNSGIIKIENAKCSGYYFNINANMEGDFQICISIPLKNYSNYITFLLKIKSLAFYCLKRKKRQFVLINLPVEKLQFY